MAKSLSARIAQRKAQGARNGKNRAAFLAVRDQVRRALDDGWSILSIWETLPDEGKVAFSYESFRRFVNRFLIGQRSKTGRGRIAVKTAKETNSGKPDQVANKLPAAFEALGSILYQTRRISSDGENSHGAAR
jgi:hypothetical protein